MSESAAGSASTSIRSCRMARSPRSSNRRIAQPRRSAPQRSDDAVSPSAPPQNPHADGEPAGGNGALLDDLQAIAFAFDLRGHEARVAGVQQRAASRLQRLGSILDDAAINGFQIAVHRRAADAERK